MLATCALPPLASGPDSLNNIELKGTNYEGHDCIIFFVTLLYPPSHTPWLLVCKQTIPTERPPLVGEVNANFCG
jgi:hypothetical protein